MAKRSFPLALLEEWDVPYENVDCVRELGGGRWSDYETVVFQAPDDGKLYKLEYEVGKTEVQDISWDEYLDDPVVLPQVVSLERYVIQKYWAEVED